MSDRQTVEELEHLYASPTREERDELLQELLVAAANRGDAMVSAIEAWLLDRTVRRTIDAL